MKEKHSSLCDLVKAPLPNSLPAMKVVLDTNCLIAAAPRGAYPGWFWAAFREERFVLCLTTEIIEEYDEILSRLYGTARASLIIDELSSAPNVEQVTVYYRMRLIRYDPDDDKFSDCAFAANADYLITHDHHFNVLRPLFFPRINVIKLKDFKLILQEEKN
jgi:putative PIN family toxin of toxin-antitoxin system